MIVPPESVTTTRMIHRAYRGNRSWWHSAIVCDLPGAFGARDLLDLVDLLPSIAAMGFSAILVRLSPADVGALIRPLSALIEAAHAHDIRVVVRISAAEGGHPLAPTGRAARLELDDNPELLVRRTRLLVDIGVDGIDLGVIEDDAEDPESLRRAEQFSLTVNQQMAELVDSDTTTILTAEAIRSNNGLFQRHVTEDWFHHLRDDALLRSPWDGEELANRIRDTYAVHDPLGQVVAWRPSHGAAWSPSAESPTASGDLWADEGSDGVPEQRFDAMMAFVATLPGALYLSFLQCGGVLRESADEVGPRLSLSLGRQRRDRFQHDLTRRVLDLRSRRDLASGTLARVSGLDWCHDGVVVYLSGPLLVVLNTSGEDVRVPGKHAPLLYSDGFFETVGDGTVVRPNTCAWFIPASAENLDPAQRR